MSRNIPLFGIYAEKNIGAVVQDIISRGQIAAGKFVTDFAEAFGKLTDQSHVVTVNDMSNAIQIALKLSGVGTGDKVLASSYACMSTNAPIATIGAAPVWVDVDPATGLMSADALEKAITPECKAVIVYHLAGYPAEIKKIAEICQRRNLKLIEDCDNALLSSVEGRQVGTFGDFAIFSFYPNRQLNATEGGALCCKRKEDAERAIKLRRYGIDIPNFRDVDGEINPESDIPEIGWAATLNNICSAIGLSQIATVEHRIARSKDIALKYDKAFQDIAGLTVVPHAEKVSPSYWVYLIKLDNRDIILSQLKKAGVSVSKIHHLTSMYTGFGCDSPSLPGAEAFFNKVLGLPCGWWLSDQDVDYVVDTVTNISRSVNT